MYYTDIIFISIFIVLLVIMVCVDGDTSFWVIFSLFWVSMLIYGYFIFKNMVVKLLDGDIERPDVTNIAQSLLWENQLKSWDIENNFINNARTDFN